MAQKRKASAMATAEDEEPVDPSDELTFIGLGGCQEVGRSCHILQYKGKTVMLDAGMHTGRDGMAAMPYFDDFDLGTVDILLISHFHLDHTAALPYVLSKTNFKGRVFMTHPTKAIYKWLIQDSVRVSNTSSTSDQRVQTQLYTEQDHLSTLPQIETIDFNTTHTISGIRITPYPAGHVLGAAMFLVSIAGLNIFFTGDYSREPDRHLISAAVPSPAQIGGSGRIDLLITESTFGISTAPPRAEREAALTKAISTIVQRGGKALLPVFALGRAQELLLILEDYWSRHPELQSTPIYYTGNTARKCMVVYQTYINAMNDNIKRMFRERMAEAELAVNQTNGDKTSGNKGPQSNAVSAGPWDFRYVRSLRNLDRFDDIGSCVMLASPGMLQSGMSRILLERWCQDARNGVIMTGYNVEGTMGRTILTEPDMIPAIMSGNNSSNNSSTTPGAARRNKDSSEQTMIPRRCTVLEVTFAAHVTGAENVEFIQQVDAPHIILVHGEKMQAARLRSRLLDLNKKQSVSGDAQKEPTKVYSPENGATLTIPFRRSKVVKVVGRLAAQPPPTSPSDEPQTITGVIVQNNDEFKLSLMAPEDLKEYAGLTSTSVFCKMHIGLRAATADMVVWALEGTFGAIEEIGAAKAANGNGHLETKSESTSTKDEEPADEEIPYYSDKPRTFLVMGAISVQWSGERDKQITLEWEGNAMNDGIADAVMAVLMTVESSPAAVKWSSQKHGHHHHHHGEEQTKDEMEAEQTEKQILNGKQTMDIAMRDSKPFLRNQHANITPEDRFSRLCMFLEAQFGADSITPLETPRPTPKSINSSSGGSDDDSETDSDSEHAARAQLASLGIPVPGLMIKVDKLVAKVWLDDLEVECAHKTLKARVEAVVERAVEVVAPLWSVARR